VRIVPFLIAVLGAAAPSFAGVVYDFTTTLDTPRASVKASGTVSAQGDCYRAETVRDGTPEVLVSCDGDKSATFIDARSHTWRNRARVGSDIRSAAIFIWPLPDAAVKGKPKVSYKREDAEPVAGEPSLRHSIDAAFNILSRVQGTAVRGSYKVTARLWTTERLPKLPMQRPIRTGYPEVDAELEKIAENIQGMILRSELEVVRRYEGGPPETEKTVTTITRMEETEIAESQFKVPEGFTYAGPVTNVHH